MTIKVKKRSGKLEELNYDKIHKILNWACENIDDVNISDIEVNAKLHLFDGIESDAIHTVLVSSAANLITVKDPNYQMVASRLLNYQIRKNVFNDIEVPHIKDILLKNLDSGVYDRVFVDKYCSQDLEDINTFINHDRDYNLSYAGVRQMTDKYLLKDRATGELYETPQCMYMFVAMVLFSNYEGHERLDYIKRFYDAVSTFKINLPTPIMCGARTPNRQYSSCTLIDIDDDLDSIIHSDAAITYYTSKRAGIGLNIGRIRGVGNKIRSGEIVHTGLIPFLKKFEASTKCCTQGGVRGGTSTSYFPFWHQEIEDLIVLKNNKGTEDNRVRKMDYGVQFSELFYKRLAEDGDITLFSPHNVKDLYSNFGINNEEFNRLYVELENSSVPQKKIKARDLFETICKERIDTGRIYIMNIDHANSHSSFLDKINMSNLCAEITLPTTPIKHIDDGADTDSEIALCVLSAINMGNTEIDELEDICELAVRALDFIVDEQDYPVKAAEKMLKRRSIGIGITNMAYYLAKNEEKYESKGAIELIDTYMEHMQYSCIKASVKLAKEFGECEYFHRTKYSKGILPIDTYHPNVDKISTNVLACDWESLRSDVLEFGMRNSSLTALMPCESSSVVSNSTNGIEPPRDLISIKKSKAGVLKQVVPEIKKYGEYYTTAWEMKDNKGYMNLVAVIQKYVDQSISANHYYNPMKYDGGNLPISVVMNDLMYGYKLGLKTFYYANTYDGKTDEIDAGCEGGACSV